MKRFITLLALSMLFTCGIANAQGIVSVGNSASTSKNAQNSATASGQGALRIADRPTGSFAVSAGVGVNNWGPALVADGQDFTELSVSLREHLLIATTPTFMFMPGPKSAVTGLSLSSWMFLQKQ